MQRIIILLFAAVTLFISPVVAHRTTIDTSKVQTKDIVVYITRTGEKYHKDSCRYLRQSKIKTTKKEAIANKYTACKVCKP